MRGRKKIFDEIVNGDLSSGNVTTGRSKDLISKRNKALIFRYYFYVTFTQLRYEVILEKLCEEFFISPYTIQARINDNYTLFSEVKMNKPEPSELKKTYPQFNWAL
jgi:hypothetical protein